MDTLLLFLLLFVPGYCAWLAARQAITLWRKAPSGMRPARRQLLIGLLALVAFGITSCYGYVLWELANLAETLSGR